MLGTMQSEEKCCSVGGVDSPVGIAWDVATEVVGPEVLVLAWC